MKTLAISHSRQQDTGLQSVNAQLARNRALGLSCSGRITGGMHVESARGTWLMIALCVACGQPLPVYAWGDEGHEIVALIAAQYLQPQVRSRVENILAADNSGLTRSTSLEQEATWADKYRDANPRQYQATHTWHFVDLEISRPVVLRAACFGHPALAPGQPASAGPANDCIVDKIDEFNGELTRSSALEQRLALQFILHLIGDLHQPLHVSDNYDHGGNWKRVRAPGLRPESLHHYWDVEFVRALGRGQRLVAQQLLARITPEKLQRWSGGNAVDWTRETYALAKIHAYGGLPGGHWRQPYALSEAYVADATGVAAEQLSKAGVRLAFILNEAFQ